MDRHTFLPRKIKIDKETYTVNHKPHESKNFIYIPTLEIFGLPYTNFDTLLKSKITGDMDNVRPDTSNKNPTLSY